MAISPISSINNNYRNLYFGESQENPTVEDKTKAEMSTQTKVILGTALAALAATGIYIATRGKGGISKLESAEQTTKDAIDKLQKCIYKKSNNTGKNIQETIENVLGKNSGITPHTYDVSKEFPAIHVYRDHGGYKDGLVTKEGIMQTGEWSKLISKATSHMPDKNGNIPGINNKVVRLTLKDLRAPLDRPTDYDITFISPNQNYTPLQKDVLKLIENKDKINLEVFDEICAFNNLYDENRKLVSNWKELNGKYANLDYDLILSAIQSMAKKV